MGCAFRSRIYTRTLSEANRRTYTCVPNQRRARDRRPVAVLHKLNGRGGAAAPDGGRYCDTKSQGCTTERQHERMIQS